MLAKFQIEIDTLMKTYKVQSPDFRGLSMPQLQEVGEAVKGAFLEIAFNTITDAVTSGDLPAQGALDSLAKRIIERIPQLEQSIDNLESSRERIEGTIIETQEAIHRLREETNGMTVPTIEEPETQEISKKDYSDTE